jgi:hypothetical protein
VEHTGIGTRDGRRVLDFDDGADAHAEVHVVVGPDLGRARYGAGGGHHVALRVPDAAVIGEWPERLEIGQ